MKKPRGVELPPKFRNVTTFESFVRLSLWQRFKLAIGMNLNVTVRFFSAQRTGAWNAMVAIRVTEYRTPEDYCANVPQEPTLPEQ